jgi:hypothetical protein
MTEELEQLIRRRLNILWHLASTKPRTERVRLIELARGYRPGWVWHVKRERRATPC